MSGGDEPKTPAYETVQKENHIENAKFALKHSGAVDKGMMESATRDTTDRAAGRANVSNAAMAQQAMRGQGTNKMALMSTSAQSAVAGGEAMASAAMQSGVNTTGSSMTTAGSGLNSTQATDRIFLQHSTNESQRNVAKSAKKQTKTNSGIDFVGAVGGSMAADYSQFADARTAGMIGADESWNPTKMRIFNGSSAWDKTPKFNQLYSQGIGVGDMGRYKFNSATGRFDPIR